MSIKRQLAQALIRPTPVQKGKITKVTERSIFVSSPVGLKEFQVDSPGAFKTGDSIKFQGNTYLGKLPPDADSQTYVV